MNAIKAVPDHVPRSKLLMFEVRKHHVIPNINPMNIITKKAYCDITYVYMRS